MRITVLLFARARDLAGTSRLEMVLPEEASVRDARRTLGTMYPPLQSLIPSLLMAINGDYAQDETLIPDGCELAAFPPVSGG